MSLTLWLKCIIGTMRSKFEIRAQSELEDEGYFVDWKLRPSMPNPHYATDYFHLFDLLAWKNGVLRMISIKGKDCPKKHKDDLSSFTTPDGVSVELWRYDRDPKDKRKLRRRITFYD